MTLAVLAGGTGTRMGRDKALLTVGGPSLTELIIRRLRPLFRTVLVAAGDRGPRTAADAAVRDVFPGRGPLAGIHAALIASATPWVFVVPCDMPLVTRALVRELAGAASDCDAVVGESARGLEPLLGCYCRSVAPVAGRLLARGQCRVRTLLDEIDAKIVSWDDLRERIPERVYMNVNTPEDYEKVVALYSEGRPDDE